jgi:uncharacterized RDD family membrane protein YckC
MALDEYFLERVRATRRDKNTARVRTRIFSGLIDYGFVWTITIAYILIFGHPNEEGGQSVEGLAALPLFLFWVIYFPGIEGVRGQTLGKRILGIRVVKQNGQEITFGTSLVRHLFDTIDMTIAVGILVMKSTAQKQRIGDLIAKTVVLEDQFVRCEKCNEELELTPREERTGQFVCPKCNHENKLISDDR